MNQFPSHSGIHSITVETLCFLPCGKERTWTLHVQHEQRRGWEPARGRREGRRKAFKGAGHVGNEEQLQLYSLCWLHVMPVFLTGIKWTQTSSRPSPCSWQAAWVHSRLTAIQPACTAGEGRGGGGTGEEGRGEEGRVPFGALWWTALH